MLKLASRAIVAALACVVLSGCVTGYKEVTDKTAQQALADVSSGKTWTSAVQTVVADVFVTVDPRKGGTITPEVMAEIVKTAAGCSQQIGREAANAVTAFGAGAANYGLSGGAGGALGSKAYNGMSAVRTAGYTAGIEILVGGANGVIAEGDKRGAAKGNCDQAWWEDYFRNDPFIRKSGVKLISADGAMKSSALPQALEPGGYKPPWAK